MINQKNLYKNVEDSSKNNINSISLIPEGMNKEESSKINLEVILILLYQQKNLNFFVQVSTVYDGKTDELKFNMREIIEQIFSKLDKNFTSELILSYYINNGSEKNDDKFKTYIYLGEINTDNNLYLNLFLKIPKDKKIYLKLRQKLRREKLFNPEYFKENEAEYSNFFKEINLNEEEEKTNKIGGRGKEKSIGHSLIKVCMLKYIKSKDKNLSLDIISDLIGCKKKTLYYYEKEILKARENGFDFNKNSKSKMNVLIDNKSNKRV